MLYEVITAIMRWRQDGTILFFNEYAETLFGWRADEIRHRLGASYDIIRTGLSKKAQAALPPRD